MGKLPDSKRCPECGKMFSWPKKTTKGRSKAYRIAKSEWFRRTYCSNACRMAAGRKKQEKR